MTIRNGQYSRRSGKLPSGDSYNVERFKKGSKVESNATVIKKSPPIGEVKNVQRQRTDTPKRIVKVDTASKGFGLDLPKSKKTIKKK